jgi:hypothetical protein
MSAARPLAQRLFMAARPHQTPEKMRELARRPRPSRKNPAPLPVYPQPGGPARRFYSIITRGIVSDLGGTDAVPTALRELIASFAGCATLLRTQNEKIIAGDAAEVVVSDYAVLVSSLVKLGSRIGLRRVPKEVVSLENYLDDLNQRRGANGNNVSGDAFGDTLGESRFSDGGSEPEGDR